MTKRPSLSIAVACYVVYLIIVIGAMMASDTNYLDMVGSDVIFGSIVLPLALGAIFLFAVISWLGWWKPLMHESELASPTWLKWPFILLAAAMIILGLIATEWSNISATHLLFLAAAGILVGFNEEALCRGIMVLGFREGGRSEAWVLIITALFFGFLHLPNALIGMPLWGAGVQIVFATMMGAGFYVIRRTTGSLLIPMVIHGLWDFASFSRSASGGETPSLQAVTQFSSYGIAIVSAVILIVAMRGKKSDNEA